MKLFSRLYRLNLLATLSIFVLSSCVYYFLVRYIIIDQFDDSLQIERVEIQKYVAHYDNLPQIIPVKDQLISFTNSANFEKASLQTVMAFDTIGRDTAEFRKLFFSVRANGQWYRAMIGKSMEGTENLIHTVIAITIVTILLILIVSFTINRIVLRKLWQPFYSGLQLMKDYQVGRQEKFTFPKSNTEEFEFMNAVLQQATTKADKDYLLLKQFTENASHEMQTPLAIIRSKIDLVIQDDSITSRHEKNLEAMYQAIEKLSTLNHSLLLLTKIGNNQYAAKENVELELVVKEKLQHFEEIMSNRQIAVHQNVSRLSVSINPALLDTLLNNLYSNAVKHNKDGGTVRIVVNPSGRLIVANTGSSVALDDKRVFSRFYKPGESSQTGLGLSIIKEICMVSGCNVHYHFEGGFHSFIVEWKRS